MESTSSRRSFGLESDPEAEARREAGSKLVRSMIRLSVPSFVTLASLLVFWLIQLFALQDRPSLSPFIGLVVFTMLFAMIAQLVTVPKAAVLLYRQFREVPPESRVLSVLLFCVCLAGFGVYVTFAAFF